MRVTLDDGDRPVLLARLGLPESTSDADLINAATRSMLAEQAPTPPEAPPQEPTAPATTPSGPQTAPPTSEPQTPPQEPNEQRESQASSSNDDDDDEDVVVVDAQAYRALTARANDADAIREQQRVQRRDQLIEDAIAAGKFGPGRRDHYRARYDDDPDGVTARIARMSENVIPLHERGRDVAEEQVETDSYPQEWVPEVAARSRTAQAGGAQQAAPTRTSRVTSEE